MADAYSYPLLVELEETNIPRLKIKLLKYFLSEESNGGECEVEYENGSRTAMVHFRRERDQRNVLAKDSHQISLEKSVLKLTVCLPPEEKSSQDSPCDEDNVKSVKKTMKKKHSFKKEMTRSSSFYKCLGITFFGKDKSSRPPKSKISDVSVTNKLSSTDESSTAAKVQRESKGKENDTVGEALRSTSALLGNIPNNINQEVLKMLVENILKTHDSKSSSQSFTLEVLPDISSAVVTFQSVKENTDFLARCPQNKMFTKKGLSVRPLEVTNQVLVDDIHNNSEEYLHLYFENEGGDVEDVIVNEVEQSAVITFKDHQAFKKIMKRKHYIKKEEIRVYPYYKSLGRALYGKDKRSLKFPAAISEPIDSTVLRYLANKKSAAQTICSEMEKQFCNITLGQTDTVTLSPVSSLLKQKDAKVLIKEWSDTVKSAFAQSVSKFKSLKFHPDPEAWEESEKKLREKLLNEDVIVVPDKASGVLSVSGLVSDINRLERSLSEIINETAKQVHRQRSSKTEQIKVSPSIFYLLCKDGLEDKLLHMYPELKISPESPNLKITGLGEEITKAKEVIFKAVLALKRNNLKIDNYVLELLKHEQQEKLTDALLTSHRINAAFNISGNRVQLVAVSDRDLSNAQNHLTQLLTSQFISVEDSNVLKKPEWQQLVSQLEQANSKPCRTRINTTAQQVVVSGCKDNVINVGHQLNDFLTQNAHIEVTVVVKADIVIEYLKHFNTNWLEKVKDKVKVSYRNEAICLSGSRVDVTRCKTVVEGAVSSVVFDSLNIYKCGAKKLFQENKTVYFSEIKHKTGSLIQLVDETGGGDSLAFKQAPTPLCQFKTPQGVEIAVCKADMCSYPVQAVVNPSNQNLKHNAGLAAALLKAAGPQLQDECDNIIKAMGQLKPGDCVITGAGGQLCCQKVIHVVGPKFDKDKPQTAWAQLKKAVKGSLELAETSGCVSVALPSIGSGLGCFPFKQCELAIVRALKEYCDEKYDDITLQKIHLVNIDDVAVQDMVDAVRQEFGNLGVTHSQQTLPKPPKPSVLQPTGSDLYFYRMQTKERLDIILIKGSIEAAMTEVLVSMISSDLDLNKGAVSKGILRAAGPKLQQLINAQGANGNVGEVIVTEGCNLNSKKVFHAIAPHWDNGHGTAEKCLSGIFKDCLEMAENNNLTSISLPAIGPENLGFPTDLIASLMLDQILEFSKKKHPKHLKRVVIVLHPGDAEIIQAFSDAFKKFPNVSGGSSSTKCQRGFFSKLISTSDMHETKMGNVTIQVFVGDIMKETTDIIVNSSNESFSLMSGVSKAILEAAGKTVEVECRNLGVKSTLDMKMTQPGNLKCKKILHLVGQSDPVKIKELVKAVLQMCLKTTYTSISFPAIGTGQGNVKARLVADAMLDAVIDVLSQNTFSPLTKIRIVIFQKAMLKDFHSSMQQREAADPKDKGQGTWGGMKALFGLGKQDKDFDIKSLKVDPTCFHICGDTQANVDLAKKLLHDKASQERQTTKIEDNAIRMFSKADHLKIFDMQKTMGISIKIECSTPKPTITIEGLSTDVLNAKAEIIKMISRNRDADIPEHWEPVPANATCQVFTVQAKTSEYAEIRKLFQASSNHTVTKIERIQNPVLWKSLQLKKHKMEVKNGHKMNERRLFHGTCETTVPHINDHGFNRSYAGKNAALYGDGTYFAVNASYSASDTYSKPNQKGEKFMYVCQVLTGDFTLGKKGMVAPPVKNTSSTDRYDSVVDNMANPDMFVIFHDDHAYPEYLITFK
ncbi:protein mono-ADP-ribosyltransferase PARP14-like [Archocentrus centrarchus]|uniref:protein mono-ADP-ribosyltransferase PARP14-like n=1 Tax=Archocentrus centrarchus TaxID=63155 RepID=UPI0011EA39B0|nr:protein mono-ADP-ribosyltransferase PARP14-like [Archocentrus centrarchus]